MSLAVTEVPLNRGTSTADLAAISALRRLAAGKRREFLRSDSEAQPDGQAESVPSSASLNKGSLG